MDMHHRLQVGDTVVSSIDWDMTPELTFGTFESWGGVERIRSSDERVYYFYVDNWGESPRLYLMERGVKHARIMAEIDAPESLLRACVDGQGEVAFYDQSFAIDEPVRRWLIEHVLEGGDGSLVKPLEEVSAAEDMGPRLPPWDGLADAGDLLVLPSAPEVLTDEQAAAVIREYNFFDTEANPAGTFANHLHDAGEQLIVDQRTGLMWQRAGIDITSIRSMHLKIASLNTDGFAGFKDWRLPSLAEAMSLLDPHKNDKGCYIDPNFSREQPFIFVAARRSPGGYWFVDFKQGRAFWSSGSIPGGFGRLCRSLA
jgi:hypothetical protein